MLPSVQSRTCIENTCIHAFTM